MDRFGRNTMQNAADRDREFESMLTLPAERRISVMDIMWAERDKDRLIVLAWMMPYDAEVTDATGEYGAKGSKHRLTRATLIVSVRGTPIGRR